MRVVHLPALSFPTGDRLQGGALGAVKIDLLDASDGVLDVLLFAESRRAPVTWVIGEPVGAELSYRYRVTRSLTDCAAVVEEPRSTASTTLLIPARAG